MSDAENNFKKTERPLSTEERDLIQRELIEEFCRINEVKDMEQRNACAALWIGKYADNFDQLDGELIEEFRWASAENDPEKIKKALAEIQRQLEELNKT